MKKLFVAALMLLALGGTWMLSLSPPATAAGPAPSGPQPKPVEDDMHEFMEYVFQPTYKRLKTAMAAAPADNSAWKGIKADALILAEGGNLLMIRPAQENTADWNTYSADVRELGGQLYRAAKMKDFAAARKHYEAMLMNCNRCHDKFAHGEHQLSP